MSSYSFSYLTDKLSPRFSPKKKRRVFITHFARERVRVTANVTSLSELEEFLEERFQVQTKVFFNGNPLSKEADFSALPIDVKLTVAPLCLKSKKRPRANRLEHYVQPPEGIISRVTFDFFRQSDDDLASFKISTSLADTAMSYDLHIPGFRPLLYRSAGILSSVFRYAGKILISFGAALEKVL